MMKLLLTPHARLALILCAGLSGLALKAISTWSDVKFQPLDQSKIIVVLASLCGFFLFILFVDMANFGYLTINIKKYPPMGVKYVPILGAAEEKTGVGAVLQGWTIFILGVVLSAAVSVVLISLWMSLS